MDSAESIRAANGDGDGTDLALLPTERTHLLAEIADVFPDQASADSLLDRIGFPVSMRPAWAGMASDQWWGRIARSLTAGAIPTPNLQLLTAVVRVYAHNQVFRGLAVRYGLLPTNGVRPEPQPQSQPAPEPEPTDTSTTCHVIVRASSEEARREALEVLRAQGLNPEDVWSTAHAVSYRVNLTDVRELRRRLDTTDLGWTVVPPGASDYLIRELYVEGPDGRRFRLLDAPAQQTVGNVAAEIVDQYRPDFADRSRPTVVDHELTPGKGERLDPERTLHDSGVRERSLLRVGFPATAGAVNPLDRQDALSRVRNELLAVARTRPDLVIRAAPPNLPTEYELDFTQRSLGPPASERGEPVDIDRHTVLIQLPADFPEKPPRVYWLTPIFHPNVFPNYPCDLSREQPYSVGLVCLGVLAESYLPGLDFGELAQTLIAMAAYRNYALFEPTGEVGADGRPLVRGNFYDYTAARWAVANQERIADMGGALIWGRERETPEYRNVVEVLD